ncbi:MAG: uridine kinase [Flavobacteriales bacterium]|nr:uridine kinase [Flavobacteriales bacterium]
MTQACLKAPILLKKLAFFGAGKTTLLRRLSDIFGEVRPSIFSMDNYYFPKSMQQLDSNGIVNFDLPTAIDEERLTADLKSLMQGKAIEVKEYFFNSPPDKNVLITIQPSAFIIVEGLFLFHYKEVFKSLDYSIFVDVDHATQLDRRIYRDQETRGYSREDILYQWENHVLPCYANFIEPYMNTSDFIFRNDQHADEDFKILSDKLASVKSAFSS